MLYIIFTLIALAAAAMPSTFWPDLLALLAGALAVIALAGLVNYSRMVSQAAVAKVPAPSMGHHALMWLPVLVLASLVHWFPLVCLLFTFVVEACIYADLRDLTS